MRCAGLKAEARLSRSFAVLSLVMEDTRMIVPLAIDSSFAVQPSHTRQNSTWLPALFGAPLPSLLSDTPANEAELLPPPEPNDPTVLLCGVATPRSVPEPLCWKVTSM